MEVQTINPLPSSQPPPFASFDGGDVPMFKTDDGTYVQFHWIPVKNTRESESQGRPIYDRSLVARIFIPGDRLSIIDKEIERHFGNSTKKVNHVNAQRFAKPLAAFLGGSVAPETMGTPLSQIPSLDVAQIAAMRDSKIYTVEQLAGVSDSNIHQLGMGAFELRAKAKAYLEQAKGQAPIDKLIAENRDLRTELEAIKAQLSEISKLKTPESGQPAKRKYTRRTASPATAAEVGNET